MLWFRWYSNDNDDNLVKTKEYTTLVKTKTQAALLFRH